MFGLPLRQGLDFFMVVEDLAWHLWSAAQGGPVFVRLWLAANLVCPSPAAFVSLALRGQTILIRADLGTLWAGRKRTKWISWDVLLSGV